MPTYEIQAPNGKMYSIEGPAGASDDQVRTEVLRQFPEAGAAAAPSASAPARDTTAGLHPGMLAAKGLPYIGAPLAVLTTPGGAQAAKETARTTIPVAVGAATGGLSVPLQSAAQMATTYGMQKAGLEEPSWFQVALSGALPFAAPLLGRLWRGGERTATRLMPSRFEAAQKGAAEAGEKLVEGLRPATAASGLAEAAGAAAAGSSERVALPGTMRLIEQTRMLPKRIDPSLAPFEDAVENLKVIGGKGGIDLRDLEELRQQLGPFVSKNAKVKGLYGALLDDLEAAAKSNVPGAALAREAAAAYKRQLGANLIGDLVTKASPARLISGANVPALNVATFANAVNKPDTQRQLLKWIGPEGLAQVNQFIFAHRNLPPDVAFNAANRLIGSLGAAAGGIAGFGVASIPGAMVGAITPELVVNMLKAGPNAPGVNTVVNALASGARAGLASSGDLMRETGARR